MITLIKCQEINEKKEQCHNNWLKFLLRQKTHRLYSKKNTSQDEIENL